MGKLTHTVSGNPVSFKSADKSNIESLKVYFSPIQEGTGDPSSSNVRPIYPLSTIKVRTLNDYIAIVPSNQQQIYYSTDNNYRLEHISNGRFKLLDSIGSEDYPRFDINIVPIVWPASANRLVAVSNIKQSIGKWNFTFSLRNEETSDNLSGYFEFATDPQALIVNVNDNSSVVGKTYTSIRLVFTNTITIGTEFTLGITNSSNITQHNIDLSDIPVYGGYIDLITGTLASNTIVFNLTGSEDYLTYQSSTHRLRIKDFNLTYSWSGIPPISNVFKTATDSNFSVYFATTSSGNQNLNLGFPSDYTEEQARNFIAQNKVQVVCKVNHTTTYQLTPQQLKTFCGQNNIWSNTSDDMEVTYEFTDHMAKRRLELNTPHIETASGNSIICFHPNMIAHPASLKLYYRPYLRGIGDASPTNIKTICGHSNARFWLCDDNEYIPIIPDNFQSVSSNGLTINYLGDNTFYFSGTSTDIAQFNIPIQPFTLINGGTYHYAAYIISEGKIYKGSSAVAFSFKKDTTNHLAAARNTSNVVNNLGVIEIGSNKTWTNTDQEINNLLIVFRAGWANVKMQIILANADPAYVAGMTWSTIDYGGYLDRITGERVTEYIVQTPNDNNWTIAGSTCFQPGHTPCVVYDDLTEQTINTLCTHNEWSINKYVMVNAAGQFMIHKSFFTDQGISFDTTSIANYLNTQKENGTPLQVCGKLVTPTVFSVPKLTSAIFKNKNNYILNTTCGPTTVKYWTH